MLECDWKTVKETWDIMPDRKEMSMVEKIRQWIIIIIGYGLCAYYNVWFVPVLFLFSVYIYLAGKLTGRKSEKEKVRIPLIALPLPILLWLAVKVFGRDGVGWIGIVMPIGASFYILRGISYLADLSSGKIKENYDFREVVLYLSFFPSLIAGPIALARDFLPQTRQAHPLKWKQICDGGQRILWGIFQKIVIADRLGLAVDSVYSLPEAYSGGTLLVTTVAYAIQVFFDFAGYTDIALGLSAMIGYTLPENFNLPFLAIDPSEFWTRWHISLSRWLKEYVYIPLGGSRKGTVRLYANLIVVMVVSGIWHGIGSNYLVWGVFSGLTQIPFHIRKRLKKGKAPGRLKSILSNMLTWFLIMIIGGTLVRSDSISTALLIMRRIVMMADGIQYYFVYTPAYALIAIGIHLYGLKKNEGNMPRKPLDLSKFSSKLIICVLVALTVSMAYFGQSAFIYGAF